MAREIQEMIAEVRRESAQLRFFKIPKAERWSEIVFISLGDQAHNNRPRGDSTGGLLTLAAGPEAHAGKVCAVALIAWRTWKLRRKAIGSNDAEAQSILEADARTRTLGSELHGANGRRPLCEDLVELTEKQTLLAR